MGAWLRQNTAGVSCCLSWGSPQGASTCAAAQVGRENKPVPACGPHEAAVPRLLGKVAEGGDTGPRVQTCGGTRQHPLATHWDSMITCPKAHATVNKAREARLRAGTSR